MLAAQRDSVAVATRRSLVTKAFNAETSQQCLACRPPTGAGDHAGYSPRDRRHCCTYLVTVAATALTPRARHVPPGVSHGNRLSQQLRTGTDQDRCAAGARGATVSHLPLCELHSHSTPAGCRASLAPRPVTCQENAQPRMRKVSVRSHGTKRTKRSARTRGTPSERRTSKAIRWSGAGNPTRVLTLPNPF